MLKRVSVVGTTGSGKTALARDLAQRLGVPHIELDALHWGPNWSEAPPEVFRARATQAVGAERWTCDGNYHVVRDIVWSRATAVVWLDYSLPVILWRLTQRTWERVFSREELWGGNREDWRTQLFSRDSIFLWALQTYRRRRRETPALLRRPEYRHLHVVRLRSPREAEEWLEEIGAR